MDMAEKEAPKEKKEAPKKVQNIVRFGETNVDGTKKVSLALRQIRGLSYSFANAVSSVSGLGNKVFGDLTEDEMSRLEDIINNPGKHNVPKWLLNRRNDPETGKDTHLTTSQLEFTSKMDINRMKRIKSYRGVRHIQNLPVRGQRTRGSFRKGKVVGVSKKKAREAK
jgi:small subunit ribosomal protein S13